MISTTAWILTGLCSKKASDASSTQYSNHDQVDRLQNVVDFAIPRILKAIDYLSKRDIDNDGLLEQSHNEDWMDSVLRAGKIVYSQACWILALSNFSVLLQFQRKKDASLIENMVKMIDNTVWAIDQKLWSKVDGSYIDIQVTHHIGGPYRTLTQDISLYLVALTENTKLDSLSINNHIQNRNLILPRIAKMLDDKGDVKRRINDRLLSTRNHS
jgi:glycogen debranching enzyme